MSMKYVKLYYDWYRMIHALPDEDLGKMFRSIMTYGESGEILEYDGVVAMLFPFFKERIDCNVRAYEKKLKQCREAAKLGGLAKVANAKQTLRSFSEEEDEDKDEDKEEEEEEEEEKEDDYEYLSYQEEEKEPKLDEIEKYILENNYKMDAGEFYDHYCAVGWTIGGTPIKDWRAAIRRWVRNKENRQKAEYKPREGSQKEPEKSASTFDTDDFFEAALRRSNELTI